MKRETWQARTLLIALSLTLAGVLGCPRPSRTLSPVTDDVPAEVAIGRVNRNIEGMDFLMRAGGVSASGRLVRASGKKESFDANGTMFFRRPRNLYMELKHSLAGKIELGSNDREFWYWEQFDKRTYYTGQHAAMNQPWETDIPLRPDQFVDMLGLRELPTRTGGAGPTFVVGEEVYSLNFYDSSGGGRVFLVKKVDISRRPPFLVSAVTYYNPAGRPWMRAEMSDYEPIEGTSVLAPRRIEVNSLEDQSRIKLEFGNMTRSENARVEQERILRSPLDRKEDVGEIVRIDRPS